MSHSESRRVLVLRWRWEGRGEGTVGKNDVGVQQEIGESGGGGGIGHGDRFSGFVTEQEKG